MDAGEGPRRPNDWARLALVAMRDRGIPPTPENYLVWYTVAAEANPTLARVVQVLDTQNAPYDEERNQELFDRFFSDRAERSALEALGARIEERLSELTTLLSGMRADTASYGSALDAVDKRLRSVASTPELAELLATLRKDTQELRANVARWERYTAAHAVEMGRLRQDLATARREAETDTLTGLGNRKRFDRRLRELVVNACETGRPLSLLFADIDDFKGFNDTYGHTLGDRVLTLVAGKLREMAGPKVELFRYGGEEFAAIAVDADLLAAVEVAEALRRAVASARITRRGGSESLRRITVSLGLTEYDPGEPLGRFLERSDAALYSAKNAGRNRTSIKRSKANRAA